MRGERGGVAAVIALALPVLMLTTGLAIDYANALRIESNLQSDADSAVLAAASAIGVRPGEAAALGQNFFYAALERRGLSRNSVTLNLNHIAASNTFAAAAAYSVPVYFMSIAGYDTLAVNVSAAASPADGTRVLDIAMCIDATGSMQPVLDAVTSNALSLFANLNTHFAAANIPEFDAVRAWPIFFRDFGGNAGRYSVAAGGQVDKYPHGWESRPAGDARNYGDDVPLRAAADFYSLVDQSADLHLFVNGEVESGGGDYTESWARVPERGHELELDQDRPDGPDVARQQGRHRRLFDHRNLDRPECARAGTLAEYPQSELSLGSRYAGRLCGTCREMG